jgi:CBS domain-containing protein
VVAVLVREAMQVPVVTVRDDDGVAHAARVLLHHRISSVPVVDGDDRLVGMVSESDLLRGRVGRDPRAHVLAGGEDEDASLRLVSDVMTPRVLTVDMRADLADAAALLLDHAVKALPVLDNRRLVGVLARRDVLRAVAHPDEEVRAAVLAKLAEELPRQAWRVEVEDGVVVLDGPYGGAQRRVATVLARTVPGVVRVVGTDDHLSIDEPVHRARP